MAKQKAKSKKTPAVAPAKMAPPPAGAHEGEQKYGIGLGFLIGSLLGLLIGASVLLFFEIQRRDVLEDVRDSAIEKKTSVDTPLPTVTSDEDSFTSTENLNPGDPAVVQTSPLDGSQKAPADAEIVLGFNVDMDESTFVEENITVFSTNDTEDITDKMDISYREDSRQLTLSFEDPTEDFGDDNVIEVVLTTRIESASGTPLPDVFKMEFKTL